MKDLSENEKRLLEELEASAARLHTLCAMLELFEESDPFSFDGEHLSPDAVSLTGIASSACSADCRR